MNTGMDPTNLPSTPPVSNAELTPTKSPQDAKSKTKTEERKHLDQKIAGFATDVINFTFKEIKDRKIALKKYLNNPNHIEIKALSIFKHIFILPLRDIVDSFNPSKDTIKELNEKVESVKNFIFNDIILKDVKKDDSKITISGKLFTNLVARPFAFVVGFFNRKTQFLPDSNKIKNAGKESQQKGFEFHNKLNKLKEKIQQFFISIQAKTLTYLNSRLTKSRQKKQQIGVAKTTKYINKINNAPTKEKINEISERFKNKYQNKFWYAPFYLEKVQEAATERIEELNTTTSLTPPPQLPTSKTDQSNQTSTPDVEEKPSSEPLPLASPPSENELKLMKLMDENASKFSETKFVENKGTYLSSFKDNLKIYFKEKGGIRSTSLTDSQNKYINKCIELEIQYREAMINDKQKKIKEIKNNKNYNVADKSRMTTQHMNGITQYSSDIKALNNALEKENEKIGYINKLLEISSQQTLRNSGRA